MRSLACVALFLAFTASLSAQAVRYDWIASTTSSQCASGKICPLNVLPGTQVNICGGSVTTLSTCLASPATTYTSASAGTPCATTSQLTPATGGACLATADNQGNYGFWVLPGSYNYFLRVPTAAGGGTYGPYPLALGASAGCPLGTTCDANYATLALACSAAGSGMLWVTRAWNGLTTQSLACPMTFTGNGRIQPASGQVVTISNTITAQPSQIFSYSAGGAIAISKPQTALYPQWWGATGDDSHDDTAAIQSAADAACQLGSGCISPIVFPGGQYKTTAQLNLYHGNSGYNGMKVSGLPGISGAGGVVIDYQGPSNQNAVRSVGYFPAIENITVIDGGTGWISGWSYDGIPSHAISTSGRFESVRVDCNGKPGDGIDFGRSNYQADQATVVRGYITGCYSGVAANILDANAVGISFVGSTINNSWICVKTITSSGLSIQGGEIDGCNVNFMPGIGPSFLVSGIRTEEGLRQLWTPTGGSENVVTFIGNTFSSHNDRARQAVTTTAGAGACTITLAGNVGLSGYTFGDHIIIPGADTAGADLQTTIVSMTSPSSAGISPCIVTAVTSASLSIDATVQQDQFIMVNGGPYTFIGNEFNDCCASGSTPFFFSAPFAGTFTWASYIFSGNTWGGIVTSPFGAHSIPSRAYLTGNYYDNQGSPVAMADTSPGDSGTFTPSVYFCVDPNVFPAGCSTVGVTYTARSGTYTRIGGITSVSMTIVLSSMGGLTGDVVISPLPFSSSDVALASVVFVSGGATVSAPLGEVSPGGTFIKLYSQGAAGVAFVSDAHFTNSTELWITSTYR